MRILLDVLSRHHAVALLYDVRVFINEFALLASRTVK